MAIMEKLRKLADPEPVVLVLVVFPEGLGGLGTGAAAIVKDPTALTAEFF